MSDEEFRESVPLVLSHLEAEPGLLRDTVKAVPILIESQPGKAGT